MGIERAGYTQVGLARELNIPLNRLNSIVKGHRAPTLEERDAIAAKLGRSPKHLFELEPIRSIARDNETSAA